MTDPVSVALCSPLPKPQALTAPEIEAIYAQFKADGLNWMPLLSEMVTVEQWRERELTRVAA